MLDIAESVLVLVRAPRGRAGVGEGGGKMPGLEEGALAANTNHCRGDATVLL